MQGQRLKLSVPASKITALEGAPMNELIELILKGDDPIRVIQAARKVTNTIVPELAHLRGYIAGMSDSWARDNREQAIKEFRWELGYTLMGMAYGEQPFSITPMERVK